METLELTLAEKEQLSDLDSRIQQLQLQLGMMRSDYLAAEAGILQEINGLTTVKSETIRWLGQKHLKDLPGEWKFREPGTFSRETNKS